MRWDVPAFPRIIVLLVFPLLTSCRLLYIRLKWPLRIQYDSALIAPTRGQREPTVTANTCRVWGSNTPWLRWLRSTLFLRSQTDGCFPP